MTHLKFDSVFDAIADSPEESADLQFRADLMLVLRGYFESKSMSQKQIGEKLAVPQSRVSELMRGKISKFSADKLIQFMSRIGYRLQPMFVETKGKGIPVRCTVIKETADGARC